MMVQYQSIFFHVMVSLSCQWILSVEVLLLPSTWLQPHLSLLVHFLLLVNLKYFLCRSCGHVAGTHGDILNAHTGTCRMHTRRASLSLLSLSSVLSLSSLPLFLSLPLSLFSFIFRCVRKTCPRFLQSFALPDRAVKLQLP